MLLFFFRFEGISFAYVLKMYVVVGGVVRAAGKMVAAERPRVWSPLNAINIGNHEVSPSEYFGNNERSTELVKSHRLR